MAKKRTVARKVVKRRTRVVETAAPAPAPGPSPAVMALVDDVVEAMTEPTATWPDVMLLPVGAEAAYIIPVVTPPDVHRCQCEWPDPDITTFGPRPSVRCEEVPSVVAFQKRPVGDVGPTGAMALCHEHRVLLDHLYPGQCYYRTISSDGKIGDFA